MQFTLTIDCNNAAFAPYSEDEVEEMRDQAIFDEIAEILEKTAKKVRDYQASSAPCVDSNGNTVGRFELKED